MNSRLRVFALALALLGVAGFLASPPHALAADAATEQKLKRDYESRLASVNALADALKKDADKPGVKDTLAKVDASRKEADGVAAAGEYEIARSLLDEGYRALVATLAQVKGASGQSASAQPGMSGMVDGASGAKRERDLVERNIGNTKVLLDALKRQNDEKNAGKGAEIAKIEADTQQAQSLLAAGKVGDADKLISDAYALAKATIAGMQKGSSQMSGMADGQKKSEIDAKLKSIGALREALKRRNPNAAEIARSEQISGEASRLATSSPDKALALAEEAYDMLKAALKSGGS